MTTTAKAPPRSPSDGRPASKPPGGSPIKDGRSVPSNGPSPAPASGTPSPSPTAMPPRVPLLSGYGDGERLMDGLPWMVLGAAFADTEILTRVLAMPTTGWPRTPGRMLDAMKTCSRREFRDFLWEWCRRRGVTLNPSGKLIDGIIAFVSEVADRQRHQQDALEISARARLMPREAFKTFVANLHNQLQGE